MNQKPPVSSRVNWNNPLSKDLIGCWLFNENQRQIGNYVNPTSSSTITGTNNGSPASWGWNFSTESYGLGAALSLANVPDVTMLISADLMFSSNDDYILSTGQFTLRKYSANGLYSLTNIYGTQQLEIVTGSAAVNGDMNLAIIKQASLSNIKLIVNNKIDINQPINNTPNNQSTGINFMGGVGEDWQGTKGKLYWAMLWKRALNLNEIQSIFERPFQFIIPGDRLSFAPRSKNINYNQVRYW